MFIYCLNMKKITTEYLSFEEELLVAVYYNNVEKLKWLIGMDYFKPSMVTEPIDFGEVSVPLYWLTICYHYMFRYEEFKDVRKKVDEILSLWQEQFNLDTKNLIDIQGCYRKYQKRFDPEDGPSWMRHFILKDYINSGLREIDYQLYIAISTYNIKEIVNLLLRGAIPDARVIDTDDIPRSAYSMFRYWNGRMRERYLCGEEKPVTEWDIIFLINNGLKEIILFLLESSIQNRTASPVETFSGEESLMGYGPWIFHKADFGKIITDKINNFIHEIDEPGAVLSVFDEGKLFGCGINDYKELYRKIFNIIFYNSKYIKLRVGGYSDRAAMIALKMVKQLPKDRIYVEHLTGGDANYEYKNKDPRIRVIGMEKYGFNNNMEIVKQADEYDFKSFGNINDNHTMVYYYVNNIDTGWYDENGKFTAFYNKYRGLQAITDVVMIKGYEDMTPATSVMCTFTYYSGGTNIYCGGTSHKDRRSRVSSQKSLIESAGIKCLDLTATPIQDNNIE